MIHLLAPAKLNLILEVIRRREDGYHEVASIMQTIDLADRLTIAPADDLELIVTGPEAAGVPEDPTQNLAYRAASALREAAGSSRLGARIELEKRIPAAAGLGGGSSDAAAVLRGLDHLWGLKLPLPQLEAIAATLGSDVTFFLYGGTALATGRGEVIETLPDLSPRQWTLFIASQPSGEKTRSMYAALRPDDFSDGTLTREAAAAGLSRTTTRNAFDRAVAEVFPDTGAAMALCRDAFIPVIAAGAGPSFFSPTSLGSIHPSLISALASNHRMVARAVRTLSAADTLAIKETP